jgi:hypothetical protein
MYAMTSNPTPPTLYIPPPVCPSLATLDVKAAHPRSGRHRTESLSLYYSQPRFLRCKPPTAGTGRDRPLEPRPLLQQEAQFPSQVQAFERHQAQAPCISVTMTRGTSEMLCGKDGVAIRNTQYRIGRYTTTFFATGIRGRKGLTLLDQDNRGHLKVHPEQLTASQILQACNAQCPNPAILPLMTKIRRPSSKATIERPTPRVQANQRAMRSTMPCTIPYAVAEPRC